MMKDIGRQQLLLRSTDADWALEPLLLDNTQGLVDASTLHVIPARHVLLHLSAALPLDSIWRTGPTRCASRRASRRC